MQNRKLLLATMAGAAMFLGTGVAQAQLAPLMLMDMMVKRSQKEAAATPGHAEWCAKHRPGYRANWNNWRNPNGTVSYCASPYYAPIWMVKPKG